jgi:hypothetical protein
VTKPGVIVSSRRDTGLRLGAIHAFGPTSARVTAACAAAASWPLRRRRDARSGSDATQRCVALSATGWRFPGLSVRSGRAARPPFVEGSTLALLLLHMRTQWATTEAQRGSERARSETKHSREPDWRATRCFTLACGRQKRRRGCIGCAGVVKGGARVQCFSLLPVMRSQAHPQPGREGLSGKPAETKDHARA